MEKTIPLTLTISSSIHYYYRNHCTINYSMQSKSHTYSLPQKYA